MGKSPDTVVSMVHDYFQKHGLGEKNITIHADNCSSQNKNNTMIWYLAWRVMNGLHKRITYSFMVPGHTKFSPDGFFGLIKLKLRKSEVDDIDDLIEIVNNSTTAMYNLAQPVYENSERKVDFYQWNAFLSKYFKILPGISKYYHFLFESEHPGYIKYKRCHSDDFGSYNCLLKDHSLDINSINLDDELKIKEAIGLSASRQWYLYDQIRDLVQNPNKRNNICPEPSVPRH